MYMREKERERFFLYLENKNAAQFLSSPENLQDRLETSSTIGYTM